MGLIWGVGEAVGRVESKTGSNSSWSSIVSVVRLEAVETGDVESVLCDGAGEESVDLTCEAESEVQGFVADRVLGAAGSEP